MVSASICEEDLEEEGAEDDEGEVAEEVDAAGDAEVAEVGHGGDDDGEDIDEIHSDVVAVAELFDGAPEGGGDAEGGEGEDEDGHEGGVAGEEAEAGRDADDEGIDGQEDGGVAEAPAGEEPLEGALRPPAGSLWLAAAGPGAIGCPGRHGGVGVIGWLGRHGWLEAGYGPGGNGVGVVGEDAAEELEADGEEEGHVEEADRHVERVEEDEGLLGNVQHDLEGGEIDGAAGIDAGEHAADLGAILETFAEEEVAGDDGGGDGEHAGEEREQLAARSAAAESAGEQHERDGQGDHGAGERLLDPRHPGRVEEVADEDAE